MRRHSARLAAAGLLAAALLPAWASTALAECANLAIDPIDHVDVGAAFMATVAEVSDDVDPNPDGSSFDVHLKLSVNAVYYGSVPKVLEFNTYNGFGCSEFRTDRLQVGERIIIAAEGIRPSSFPAPPFEGHVVAWKKADDQWAFFEDALAYGGDPLFYPGAPRSAATKAEVLDVIAAWTMPETSAADAPRHTSASSDFMPSLFGGFSIGLAVAIERFRRLGLRDIPRR